MRRPIRLVLLITIILSYNLALAQKQWTLDECIEYALKNNLALKSQKLSTETYKENLSQSKRNRLPYISVGSDYNINFGKSVDPNTNDVTYNQFSSNNYRVSGSISLFNGFIRKNQIDYQRFVYQAEVANEITLKNDIAFEVMNAYYNSLYLNGLLEIVEQQKELSKLNLEKVKKQAEVGISAKTDILEIDARLANEELLLIRTQNNCKSSILDLKRAMNFPVGEEIILQEVSGISLIQSVDYENADSVYQLALEHLPTVKSKHRQLKAVEKKLAISKGVLSPSISLSGNYNTGYYETRRDENGNTIPFNEQFKNNAAQNIGVSLSIPIVNRWRSRSDIKLDKLALEKEKVDLQNFKNQLYYEIESYCQDLSAVSAEYLQAKKQAKSNQLVFEVAKKKKEQGMISIIDFYTGKNALSTARGDLLRTKLEYLMKRKTIDFYLGKPIFGIMNYE